MTSSVTFREPVPMASHRPPGVPDTDRIPHKDQQHFNKCRKIRDRYANGVPLNPEDHAVVMDALRKHPKAAGKIGKGVAAIVVGQYINDTRCFFVIRTDGSVEDFSLSACFYPSYFQQARTPGLLARMRGFDYRAITRKFQAALRHLPAA